MKWTIYGTAVQDGKVIYRAGQDYETKAAAVAAMNGKRKPKTAITRSGHTYTYIEAD